MDSFLMVTDVTPFADLADIACMIKEFRLEYDSCERLVSDHKIYLDWIADMRSKKAEFYYVKGKGYLVVEPYYDMLLKSEYAESYLLTSIYVRPEYRRGRTYGILGHGILKKYKSNMVASAMLNGDHEKVLERRFKKIASVYALSIYWDNQKEPVCHPQ